MTAYPACNTSTVEGEKKYHPGGEAKGKYWMIGDLDGPLFIAEGFATAATITRPQTCAVAIAFSAGNLVSVTGTMREKYGATAGNHYRGR
jgi:putative DNA primase/helicase